MYLLSGIQLSRVVLYLFDEGVDVLRVEVRVDPVSEVGDVAARAEAVNHRPRLSPDGVGRRIDNRRVDVALQCDVCCATLSAPWIRI